jgi:type IV secretory pathway VirB10-like protein
MPASSQAASLCRHMPRRWQRGRANPIVSENDNEKPAAKPAEKVAAPTIPTLVPVTVPTVLLDEHRSMTAQKATETRRHTSEVRADQEALRESQAALEKHLFTGPAASWSEAGEKAAYLLRLFATTGEAQDPRYRQLIEDTLDDLRSLAGATTKPAP